MFNKLRYFLKKNIIISVVILKIKFFLKYGLEPEVRFVYKNFNFNNSIDVGSNSGHVTNVLSKICKNVYSFEPIDYLYRAQKVLFKNKNVKVFNYALGDRNHKKVFYVSINNDPESSFLLKKKDSKKKKIKIIRGDSALKNNQIDFIKIDVEGFELNVIKGFKNLINKYKPILLIEIEKRHNSDFKKIFNLLNKKNYKIYFFNKNKNKLVSISHSKIEKFINRNQNLKFLGSGKYINNFFFKNAKSHFFEKR